MSYGISILFAQAENKAEAFQKMSNFVASVWDRRYGWLDQNRYYIPSHKYGGGCCNDSLVKTP